MGRQLTLALLAGVALAGCGEKADQKDFIDAPTVSTDQKDQMKARGLTSDQIAAASKNGPGNAAAVGNNPR